MSASPLHTRWDDLKQRLQQTTLATQAAPSRDRQRTAEVYRERAALLAAPKTQTDSSRSTTPALVFVLGDQRFGVPLIHVAQVYPDRLLTPVPRTPSWVLGIANIESQVRSVIDLANLLDISADRPEAAGNILLVRCSDGSVAVRVDRVEEVQQVDFAQLIAPDQQTDTARTRLIHGVTSEHLVMLSVNALLMHTITPRGDFS